MGPPAKGTNCLRFTRPDIESLSANRTDGYVSTFKRSNTLIAHRDSRKSNKTTLADAAIRRKKDSSEDIEGGAHCAQQSAFRSDWKCVSRIVESDLSRGPHKVTRTAEDDPPVSGTSVRGECYRPRESSHHQMSG